MPKYQTYFRDSEPIHGGWFSGEIIEAKNLKEAQKICAELYTIDGKYDICFLDVREVKN